MKKSYNVFLKLPFIKLSDKEVKVIEEAIKICDRGNKFGLKLWWNKSEEKEFEEIRKQRGDFQWGKIYLNNILEGGNLDHYQKKKKYLENFSKWKKATYEAYERKGNLPIFDLKNGRIIKEEKK